MLSNVKVIFFIKAIGTCFLPAKVKKLKLSSQRKKFIKLSLLWVSTKMSTGILFILPSVTAFKRSLETVANVMEDSTEEKAEIVLPQSLNLYEMSFFS